MLSINTIARVAVNTVRAGASPASFNTGLLAENPDKLPQTDDSTAQFINRFSSILMGYTDMNVLASALWRGSDVGPVQCALTPAGSVESIVITVNVQV